MHARPHPLSRLLGTFLAATVALLMWAPHAGASGSVDVTMATKTYTLSVTQTFRKTLMPGDTTYYPRVRKNFRARIAALDGPVRLFVEGPARKRVKALSTGALTLPVHSCKTADCPLAGVQFPALVELQAVTQTGNDRTAYTFALPFSAPPTKADLLWLRGEFHKLVDGVLGGGKDSEASPTVKLELATLTPVVVSERSFEVRVHSSTLVHKRDAAWFEQQLRTLAKARAAAVKPLLRKVDGITFGRFKQTLKPYDGRGTMPASLVLKRHKQKYQLTLSVGLEAAEEEEAVKALEKALEAAISR